MASTINTIPASAIVNVTPSVLNAGGAGLDLIGLMLTKSKRVPIGTVLSFPSSTQVASYFGAGTDTNSASVYFAGYTGAFKLPGAMLCAQYPLVAVGAWVRGGNISSLPLATLQTYTGVVNVVIDGTTHSSAAINLASATSFSSAAQLITTGLGLTGPTSAVVTGSQGAVFNGTGNTSVATLTVNSVSQGVIFPNTILTSNTFAGSTTVLSQISGTVGGAGVYSVANLASSGNTTTFTGTSTTLNVSAVASGNIALGNQETGSGVSSGTFVTALGTGTGQTGTYITTVAQQFASTTLTMVTPTVTYDSISGGFEIISSTTGTASTIGFASGTLATPLLLTQATGAVTSQGAAAAVPSTFMNGITSQTQNWASFWTAFDPDAGNGNAQKQLFAAWVNAPTNGQTNRFAYMADDTDITPTESQAATTSLGYILQQSGSSGTVVNYEPNAMYLNAFSAGYVASLDFTRTNGRATAAFKGQTGLGISVTNQTVSTNLIANGYNFTGDYATANQQFQWYFPGSISGPFQWLDSYVNQIWLNNALQLAMMELLNNVGSIPYNPSGMGLIRQALLDPIVAAVNFGAIRTGVTLSNAQIAEVNNQAGIVIAPTLQTQGWYLQIGIATAQVREARMSPPMTLWYVDGESVQSLSLASVLIQ